MRTLALACLTPLLLLTVPADARAQIRPKLRIDQVRVGIPAGSITGHFKSGSWAPLYVDVTAGPDGLTRGEVAVETTDSDDVRNVYRVALPPLEPNEPATILTYTKPSSLHTEIV